MALKSGPGFASGFGSCSFQIIVTDGRRQANPDVFPCLPFRTSLHENASFLVVNAILSSAAESEGRVPFHYNDSIPLSVVLCYEDGSCHNARNVVPEIASLGLHNSFLDVQSSSVDGSVVCEPRFDQEHRAVELKRRTPHSPFGDTESTLGVLAEFASHQNHRVS